MQGVQYYIQCEHQGNSGVLSSRSSAHYFTTVDVVINTPTGLVTSNITATTASAIIANSFTATWTAPIVGIVNNYVLEVSTNAKPTTLGQDPGSQERREHARLTACASTPS